MGSERSLPGGIGCGSATDRCKGRACDRAARSLLGIKGVMVKSTKIDDVLNYLPARLVALTYALLGKTALALRCWRTQAPLWDSPNAGPVMAAGAGALGVSLGGAAEYHGELHIRPELGAGPQPKARDIERALNLVNGGVLLWLALLLLWGAFYA